MRSVFRASDSYFSISKHLLVKSERAKLDKKKKTDFENLMAQVVTFWPKIRPLRSSGFQIENSMVSKIQHVIHTAHSIKTVDELDGDTSTLPRA